MGAKVDITSECKIYSGPSIIMHANNYCEFTREREVERENKAIHPKYVNIQMNLAYLKTFFSYFHGQNKYE